DTSRQTKNLNKLLIRILLHLQVEFSRNKNEYLEASFKDAKIPILLEEANVCRNIAMAIFVFFICLLYDKYVSIYISMIVAECLFYVIAFFICIFSYKKKIRQISDRIDKSRSA
ncbi:hypothetical protein, partial [Phocaeicola vulgatus]|uniref:hypothetical protein n=1 Tax=Phocaeicola vulgatus TaxID=821 RepID=UPI003564F659